MRTQLSFRLGAVLSRQRHRGARDIPGLPPRAEQLARTLAARRASEPTDGDTGAEHR